MPIIEVQDVRKRYGDTEALRGVSLAVEEGEIFGVLGPNGAGKTTLVECISGLRRADEGRLSVAGLDPLRDRDRLRQLVGVQLQESALPDKLTVIEAIDLYASFYSHPAAKLSVSDRAAAVAEAFNRGLLTPREAGR
jgi:ABC-2 type transport system ATP-binding protein